MKKQNTQEELAEAIRETASFAVIAHSRPDGDAIGSSLAMAAALRQLGKEVQVWNEDEVPDNYTFLEGAGRVIPTPEQWSEGLQCLICLDCGEPKRFGENGLRHLETAPLSINIDHHATNTRYGQLNFVDGHAAACGCVLLTFLDALGVRLTRGIAEALYVAISTDTGSFQYRTVTPEVMHMGVRLLEAGVDVGDISRRIYQELPLQRFRVQQEVLSNMVIQDEGQVVHYSMTAECRDRLRLRVQDTKDMVDIIRTLRGVKVAAIFEELNDGLIRISLRSKDPTIQINKLAVQFGGGGHAMAAGIRMRGSLTDVRERVLQAITDILKAAHA